MSRAIHAVIPAAAMGCAAFCASMGCGGNAVIDVAAGGAGGEVAAHGGSGGAGGTTGCDVEACNEAEHPTIVIAEGQVEPDGIIVDQAAVYWANAGIELDPPSRAILRADLASGMIVKLVEDVDFPRKLASDDTFIYWTSEAKTIGRVPKNGGEVEVFYKYLVGSYSVEIVADSEHLYATDLNGDTVIRVSTKTPGDVIKVAAGDVPRGITADMTHVYWVQTKGLMKASKEDLVGTFLHESDSDNGEPVVGRIAVDEDRVYFLTWLPTAECEGEGESTILSMLKDGGDLVTVVAKEHRVGGGPMAIDDSFLYWAEYDRGRIMKVPKAGGAPIPLACGQDKPRGIAVDGNFVYWTTERGGTVMKAPK